MTAAEADASSTTAPPGSSAATGSTSTTTTPAPVPVDPTWERDPDAWIVWGVAGGDVLNVRVAPGASTPVVTTLAPDATGIRRFHPGETVGEHLWTPIEVPGGAGWVNARFLRPQGPPTPAVTGTVDPTLARAAAEVRQALHAGDHATLAALSHPDGVTFSTEAHIDASSPVLGQSDLRRAATDDREVLWGHTDGEGAPIEQTLAERLAEIAGSTALTSPTDVGFDVRLRSSNTVDNLAEWFPEGRVVEYHFAGTSRHGDFDWTSVRFVFDTSGAPPLLVGIVQDTWTI